MKEGWEIRKLGEVATITAGQSPESKYYNDQGIGMPFYQGKKEFGEKYIGKPSSWTTFVTKIAKPLDILMSVRAPVGDVNFNVGKCCIGRGLASICPGTKLDKYFMFYYLVSINDKITGKEGAVFPSISKKDIENIPIPIPPLSEQQRIVSKLDSVFEKIDALKANAENNLKNAKDLFQQVLKKELEPKEGWNERYMSEMCEILSPLVNPQDTKYRYLLHVGGANIVSETGHLTGLKTAEEERLESAKFTFDNNMVLYNKIRPYLKKVAKPNFSGLCSADMYPLSPKDCVIRGFLYYVLITDDFTEYAVKNSGRAGMPKINRNALFAYKCFIPSLSEQQRIVSILDSLSEKCKRLEENYSKTVAECDALKQAVLREVMSGK